MIINGAELQSGQALTADLCIIGSGVAGISVAQAFLSSTDKSVILLESGGLEPDAEATDLNRGSGGDNYIPLQGVRQRSWGGSSNLWAGMCRPLSALDFEKRDWLPNSGWPLQRADLEPFYKAAHELLALGPFEYDGAKWGAGPLQAHEVHPKAPYRNTVFQIADQNRRLGTAKRSEFEASRSVKTYYHATVVRLELDPSGRTLVRVHCKSRGERAFIVKARAFVLATGGLENPRLLLASRDVHKSGVGNDGDLVGRYFMEHPHTDRECLLAPSGRMVERALYYKSRPGGPTFSIWPALAMTERAQRQEKTGAVSAVLMPYGQAVHPATDFPLMEHVARFMADAELAPLAAPLLLTFGISSEQVPNPESRVRLVEEKDAYGVPRIELSWKLTAQDRKTLGVGYRLLARTIGMSGMGRMNITVPEDGPWPKVTHGGLHHMGTTRMHADPKQGVCDANAKLHAVDNLYVAGSSLFTTGGVSNPTLTISALGLRLGAHLRGVLS